MRLEQAVVVGTRLHIASVGSDVEPIIIALRAYPASKVMALHFKADSEVVEQLVARLAPLMVEVERCPIVGEALMRVLGLVAEILRDEGGKYDEVVVNPSSGSNLLSCALLSSAFVNGLQAIGVADGKPMLLPVIRLSYPEAVSSAKLSILRALREAGGSTESLNELTGHTGFDKPLLSYHIRGSPDTRGLEQMSLVSVDRGKQGRLKVSLTETARLLLLGDFEGREVARAGAERRDPLEEETG